MCGIFGIWQSDGRSVDLSAIRQVLTTIHHRGPDDEGYLLADHETGRWVSCAGADTMPALKLPPLTSEFDSSFNLALGHRRLSILDLSIAGHGPMAYQDGALWITLSAVLPRSSRAYAP